MQINSFKSVNGNPEFTFYDTYLKIGNGDDQKSLNYGVIKNIKILKSPTGTIPGILHVMTLSYNFYNLYFEEKDLERIEKIIAEINNVPKQNVTNTKESSAKAQYNQYESKSNNSKGNASSGNGCLVVIVIVMIIIAVLLFKGCVSLFSSSGSWDSDNDGLSDSFEREQGTDPNHYTWNWELGD